MRFPGRWIAVIVIAVAAGVALAALVLSRVDVLKLQRFAAQGERHTQQERLEDLAATNAAIDQLRAEMRESDDVILARIVHMQDLMKRHGCGEFSHREQGVKGR